MPDPDPLRDLDVDSAWTDNEDDIVGVMSAWSEPAPSEGVTDEIVKNSISNEADYPDYDDGFKRARAEARLMGICESCFRFDLDSLGGCQSCYKCRHGCRCCPNCGSSEWCDCRDEYHHGPVDVEYLNELDRQAYEEEGERVWNEFWQHVENSSVSAQPNEVIGLTTPSGIEIDVLAKHALSLEFRTWIETHNAKGKLRMRRITFDDVTSAVTARKHETMATRRHLHSIPETGFCEHETAAYIADRLRRAGLKVREGIGGTGIVATLQGWKPGRTLAIRADIDALPIKESTELDFASTNGNMHACGHDGHIAMALTAAEILAHMEEQIVGNVSFIFQPSEEIAQGALAMIADGAMEIANADVVIGTHLWNQMPMGYVGVNQATVFAAADMFKMTVRGHGGHGAMPHLTVDPVVAAANIINACQTVVAREISPQAMGVVTFGSVHGGSAGNVIADEVEILGTIRAYTPENHRVISDAVPRIAANVAEGLRCEATFERLAGTPAVINNPDVANWVSGLAMQTIGEDAVGEYEPISVGDDMAEFMNRVPGTYFILGASKKGTEGHHNAKFDFDEACLPIGTEIFVRAALDIEGMPNISRTSTQHGDDLKELPW